MHVDDDGDACDSGCGDGTCGDGACGWCMCGGDDMKVHVVMMWYCLQI